MSPCQRIPGRDLDPALADLLMEVVMPAPVVLTREVQNELVAQAAEAERLRPLQVQRAQYEAELAQRRYTESSCILCLWHAQSSLNLI